MTTKNFILFYSFSLNYFNCYSKLNVDMEWFVNNNDHVSSSQDSDVISEMEADLGYLPLMTISSDQPSSPLFLVDEDGSVIDRRFVFITYDFSKCCLHFL